MEPPLVLIQAFARAMMLAKEANDSEAVHDLIGLLGDVGTERQDALLAQLGALEYALRARLDAKRREAEKEVP